MSLTLARQGSIGLPNNRVVLLQRATHKQGEALKSQRLVSRPLSGTCVFTPEPSVLSLAYTVQLYCFEALVFDFAFDFACGTFSALALSWG